eukprot:2937064-Pleurochrysis_carterae.AAC.1
MHLRSGQCNFQITKRWRTRARGETLACAQLLAHTHLIARRGAESRYGRLFYKDLCSVSFTLIPGDMAQNLKLYLQTLEIVRQLYL